MWVEVINQMFIAKVVAIDEYIFIYTEQHNYIVCIDPEIWNSQPVRTIHYVAGNW